MKKVLIHCNKYLHLYVVIFFTFFFGLLTHAYRFFNLDFSHDSLLICEYSNKNWQLSIGRFLQPVYWFFRGDLVPPFLVGGLAVLWLAIANYVLIKVLEIRSIKAIALICGVTSTNAVLTFLFATYLDWADTYMLAYLLSVGAVYLTEKYHYGCLFASAAIVASLGLYQSYFNITVILFLILIVKHCLEGKESRKVWFHAIRYFIALLLGLIFYYIAIQVIVVGWKGISLSDSVNGVTGVGDFTGVSIVNLFCETYLMPIRYMLYPETFHRRISGCLNGLLFLLMMWALLKEVAINKMKKNLLFFTVLCLFLMPFGINVVFFIGKGVVTSYLTIFSYCFFYVFILMLYEELNLKKIRRFAIPMIIIITFNIVFANQVYLKKGLEFEASESFMTKVTYSIEQTDGYVPGKTPVVFVGTPVESVLYRKRTGFDNVMGPGLNHPFGYTYGGPYRWFFDYVMSYNINLREEDIDNSDTYAIMPEVMAMPIYPAKGSCKMVDDVLIVKFSE